MNRTNIPQGQHKNAKFTRMGQIHKLVQAYEVDCIPVRQGKKHQKQAKIKAIKQAQ